jgi:8-oxo-dGTP diphosphatase
MRVSGWHSRPVSHVTREAKHPPRAVVGAAIVDSLAWPTRLLAARRTEPAALAGGWELPGGKVDPGESEQAALHREVLEELGVEVVLGDQLPGPLPGGRWPLGERYAMRVWWAALTRGEPRPLEEHDQLRWLTASDLYAVPWLPADLPIVDRIAAALR